MHRMSAPPCQSKLGSLDRRLVSIGRLPAALIGDLNRWAAMRAVTTEYVSLFGISTVSVVLQLLVVQKFWQEARIKDGGGPTFEWWVLILCLCGAALLCATHVIRRGTRWLRFLGGCLAAPPALLFAYILYGLLLDVVFQ
jgi:hypothetical protein